MTSHCLTLHPQVRPSLHLVFTRWAVVTHEEKQKHVIGKFFGFMTGIKPSHIFAAWLSLVREAKCDVSSTQFAAAAERKKAALTLVHARRETKLVLEDKVNVTGNVHAMFHVSLHGVYTECT